MTPPWLVIAVEELHRGVVEIPGPKHEARILEYHATTTFHATVDEVPWCSSFVNWCVERAGLKGTKSAAARSWEAWGLASELVPGAIVVFPRPAAGPMAGHVGFCIAVIGDYVLILGGNQDNRVSVKPYRTRSIVAVRMAA